MKYSKSFERDFKWYSKHKGDFNFDACSEYLDNNGKNNLVEFDENGKTAKEVFYLYDSVSGKSKTIPTCEPELLFSILKCKGGINFMIKMWAEDRGKGNLGKLEFIETIVPEFELLDWMVTAVENQKLIYY